MKAPQYFWYQARDRAGNLVTGQLAARSPSEAVSFLLAQKVYPSSVKKMMFGSWAIFPKSRHGAVFLPLEKRTGFYLKLATLLRAGITIRESLAGLQEQAAAKQEREAIKHFLAGVEEGKSLSSSMEDHIPPMERAIIASSESAGDLDTGLSRLAATMERKSEFIRISSEVFRYPLIVTGAVILALIFMTAFVIPKYAAIFKRAEIPLPFPTRALLFVDAKVSEHIITILVILLMALSIAAIWAVTLAGRDWIDKAMVKAPVVGEIILFLSLARWADALSALIASGVGIIEAVAVAGGALDNRYLEKPLSKRASARLMEGEGLSIAMAGSGVAPKSLIQMVEVGERAGELPETLSVAGKYYGDEAARRAKKIAVLLEPLLISILGLAVLFVALAVFMPMWEMTRFAGR